MNKPLQLQLSQISEIYRVKDETSGKMVVWKVPISGRIARERLNREFEICSSLSFSGVRRPIEKGFFLNTESYCYAYVYGQGLRTYIPDGGLELDRFFSMALKIVAILEKVHDQIQGHFYINWKTILFDPESQSVHLIDFSLADSPEYVADEISQLNNSEICFFAPECFKKNTKELGKRADMYSLGVLFYFLLSGRLPFKAQSASELLDEILSNHEPQKELNHPKVIQNMIGRLMAVDAADRYQNCYSLWHDLSQLKGRLERGELEEPFNLGALDKVGEIQISQRLYGRHQQLRRLIEGFNQNRHKGVSSFLIEGKVGVGKSRLLEEFNDFLDDHDIYHVHARCESWAVQIQYILATAINDLGIRVLSGSNEELVVWESLISELYKETGSVLFKVFPSFQYIGKDVQPVDPSHEQSELELKSLVIKVLQRISEASIPLTIALSSIQNIDPDTRDIAQTLLQHQGVKDLCLIFSLDIDERIPEVNAPFINELRKSESTTVPVSLDNWTREEVNEFVLDSFNSEKVVELSELLFEKTLGHPFFIHRILKRIRNENLATFNQRTGNWSFDWDTLRAIEVSEHVIDYQLNALGQDDQKVRMSLALAACVGPQFDEETLCYLLNESREHVLGYLEQFASDYIVIRDRDGIYKWNSEDIRLRAYDYLSNEQKADTHLKIANYLNEHPTVGYTSSVPLSRAWHFRRISKSDLANNLEGVKSAYHEAAKAAINLASFKLALSHYKRLIELLDETSWVQNPIDVRKIYTEATEIAMVCDDHESGNQWINDLLSRAETTLEAVPAYEIKLNHLTAKHDFVGAVKLLLQVLDELGYTIKRHPGQLTIMSELAQALWVLRRHKIKDLPDLPLMTDPKVFAFMKLTVKGATSIFGTAPDILPIVFFRQVRFSVVYGNCVYSPFAYISFGFAISVFMNQIKKGYEFGKMALTLVDKLKAEEVRNRVLVTFYGFLSYWRDDLVVSLKPLMEAYHIGKQRGDYLYASFALAFESSTRFLCGHYLPHLLEEKNNGVNEVRSLNQDLLVVVMEIERQLVLNLIREKEDVLIFNVEGFDEEAMISKLEELEDIASKFDFYAWKLFLGCIFERFDEAYDMVARAEEFSEETTSRQITYPTFLLMSCVAGYERLKRNSHHAGKIKKDLRSKEKTMALFSKNAPQNFECMLEAIKSCRRDFEGESIKAEEHMQNAIRLAKQSRFIHLEALFKERLAHQYMARGLTELRNWMMLKSMEDYRTWGAHAKVRQQMSQIGDFDQLPFGTQAQTTIQDIHDFNTILSANNALANANTLPELYGNMLDVIRRNNSATRAIVAVYSHESDQILPVAQFSGSHVEVANQNATLDLNYPRRIFRYVRRSGALLNLFDASSNKQFRSDPYVIDKKSKSILCIPVMVKNQSEGVIFLENNGVSGVFDDSKVKFFNSIVSQFQVSLDNIMVHERLEDMVRERTRKLEVVNKEMQNAKEESERLLLNILPKETADELRRFGQTTAKRYDDVSVLFCDIVDFTKISENLGPVDLVADLDLYFKTFDEICLKHGLEKIKTVGDAYLAAGGIPDNNSATVENVVDAALDMLEYVQHLKQKREASSRSFYEIRIGIHTGPVVAGVVGSSKFQFDIWGDTVNVAARLQQSSSPGKINVSNNTMSLIEDRFEFTFRGKLPAKNKGSLDMYFVEGVRK